MKVDVRALCERVSDVRQLARMRRELGLNFAIEIDGGVNQGNLVEIVQAGCNWMVAGSHVFGSADPAATVKDMQQIAELATATIA